MAARAFDVHEREFAIVPAVTDRTHGPRSRLDLCVPRVQVQLACYLLQLACYLLIVARDSLAVESTCLTPAFHLPHHRGGVRGARGSARRTESSRVSHW